jgi:hypothetical protein
MKNSLLQFQSSLFDQHTHVWVFAHPQGLRIKYVLSRQLLGKLLLTLTLDQLDTYCVGLDARIVNNTTTNATLFVVDMFEERFISLICLTKTCWSSSS